MFICLLKANIALALFFLVYHFGLRRLTFYTLNRFFLLASICFAAIFPFINPTVFVRQHEVLNAVANTYAPDLKRLNNSLFCELLTIIFWAGVIVMGLRLLIQLFSMWKLHRNTQRINISGSRIRATERTMAPFSFLQHIYLNPSLHSQAELNAILRHEKVHVKQWHTLDILLGELNKVFYWFNPGAWLMSIAIRENLEFIADRHILRQGIDIKAYQYSLLQVSGIPYEAALTANFNFSHLKSRIVMMNKERSSSSSLLRYIVLGSAVSVVVLSLNFTHAIKLKQIWRHTPAMAVIKKTMRAAQPIQNKKAKIKKLHKAPPVATETIAAANVAPMQQNMPSWMPQAPAGALPAEPVITAVISTQSHVTRIMVVPAGFTHLKALQQRLATTQPDTAAIARKPASLPPVQMTAHATDCSCGVAIPAYQHNEEQRRNAASILSRANNASDVLDGLVVTINGKKLTYEEKLNLHLNESNVTGRVVLNLNEAREKYGAEAQSGAIEITLRN